MNTTRRKLLQSGLASLAVGSLPALGRSAGTPSSPLLPPRLQPGDVVGLINPAGATFNPDDAEIARETMEALGLRIRFGEHLLDRHGYLAGRDEDRAADIKAMFVVSI